MASTDLEAALLQHIDLEDTELEDTELEEAGLEAIYASFAALEAQHKLTLLDELGLVAAETHYRVPPVAIQCVDLAMGFLKLPDGPSDATETASNVIALHGLSRTGRAPDIR